MVQTESITFVPIDKIDFDVGVIGVLDETWMRAVILAIGWMLDSDCEPT